MCIGEHAFTKNRAIHVFHNIYIEINNTTKKSQTRGIEEAKEERTIEELTNVISGKLQLQANQRKQAPKCDKLCSVIGECFKKKEIIVTYNPQDKCGNKLECLKKIELIGKPHTDL